MKKIKWGEDPNFSGPRDYYRNSLILREISKYKNRGTILDFGCGTGNLIIRLSSAGYSCVGVDLSELSINFLKKRLNVKKIKNVSIKVAGEEFLYKTTFLFDAIVSGETLEHLEDDEYAIKGFYKCLKKNGICVVTVPARPGLWSKVDEYAGHFRRYNAEGLVGVFKKSGFSVIKVFYWGFPLGYIWDKFFLSPLFILKVEKGISFSKSNFFLSKFLSSERLKLLLSLPLWIDNLFCWTNKGVGLLLVAKK
jgi:SAM-dependent methyltransferase